MAAEPRNALLVAFHFPPCVGSSGLLRALCFARDLRALGWGVDVLTASPRAYEQTSDELLESLPSDVAVHRAAALDTRRHLSVRGRYLESLAVPDRYLSWFPFAVAAGLRVVRRRRVGVIWSTYPVATSHLIGCALARLTGRPWIADFRDPMVERDERTGAWFPAWAPLRRARLFIERLSVRYARALVFCTEGARRIVEQRYGNAVAGRTHVIPNGYDERIFAEIERGADFAAAPSPGLTLVHSGTIYRSADRDPAAFLAAVRTLKSAGRLHPGRDRIVLRASGAERWLTALIADHDLAGLVYLEPRCPYREALHEVLRADGLLVFQGYTSNPAIPAKLYEYLRSGRPIFGMVDGAGETALLLREVGGSMHADLQSAAEIAERLGEFVDGLRDGRLRGVAADTARRFSRESRAAELAVVMEKVLLDTGSARPATSTGRSTK